MGMLQSWCGGVGGRADRVRWSQRWKRKEERSYYDTFISVTNESFMPLVRAKSRSQFIKALITDMPLSIMFSTVLRLEQIYYLSLILPKLVPRSNLPRTSVRSLILIMNLLVLLISLMACSDYCAPS